MINYFTDIINIDFILRITAAACFAFCIGLERELTNKDAGLRTHILVSLGACIFTLISIYGFPTFVSGDNVDINQATGIRDSARVAAQVVTGIGFIGAGTVLRNGPIVIGLTTAATLWIAASIGMACGAGMYQIAFAGTALAILTLVLVRIFEKNLLPNSTKRTKMIKLSIICKDNCSRKIHDLIIDKYPEISEITKKKMYNDETISKITCVLTITDKKQVTEIYEELENENGIESISIQDLN
ncbi:MgtC/SapB family protein [bacterium]|nr:MgtC/SapB family protein [bacterium]